MGISFNNLYGYGYGYGYGSSDDYSAIWERCVKNQLYRASWDSVTHPMTSWRVGFYAEHLDSLTSWRYQPLTKTVSLPGNSHRLTVIEHGRYPEHIVAGVRIDYMSIAKEKNAEQLTNIAVSTNASLIEVQVNSIKKLAAKLPADYLTPESKDKLKRLVNEANAKLILVDGKVNAAQSPNGPSADELIISLKQILEDVEALKAEMEELYPELQDEAIQRQEFERDAILEQLEGGDAAGSSAGSRRGSDSASGNAPGRLASTEAPLSKDTEDEEVGKTRYGMLRSASIEACDDAADLAALAVADDMTDKTTFDSLFGKDKDISAANIVEVLASISDKEDFANKIANLKDDKDKDYSKKALQVIIKLLNERVSTLNKAGHIEADCINDVKAKLTNLTHYANNGVAKNSAKIATALDFIVDMLSGLGTEDVVKEAFEAEKQAACDKAVVEFRQDYATAENETYDASKTYIDLPEEIVYLPNRRLFQVTIEVNNNTFEFEGGNFKALDAVIVASAPEGDEALVQAWKDIKAKLLEESADV